jgi:hypothetical protein
MNIRTSVLVTAALLAGLLTLDVAQAQDSKTQQQQPMSQQSDFSQDQLESFASATLQVQEVRAKWQTQMQTADSAEKAQALQAQANNEMVSAVEDEGLTVETYNAIATAARANPDLANRITELMQQAR